MSVTAEEEASEASEVIHELAVEARKLFEKESGFSSVDEFISRELDWLASFLSKEFKLSRDEIRRKIRERLEVTI